MVAPGSEPPTAFGFLTTTIGDPLLGSFNNFYVNLSQGTIPSIASYELYFIPVYRLKHRYTYTVVGAKINQAWYGGEGSPYRYVAPSSFVSATAETSNTTVYFDPVGFFLSGVVTISKDVNQWASKPNFYKARVHLPKDPIHHEILLRQMEKAQQEIANA